MLLFFLPRVTKVNAEFLFLYDYQNQFHCYSFVLLIPDICRNITFAFWKSPFKYPDNV